VAWPKGDMPGAFCVSGPFGFRKKLPRPTSTPEHEKEKNVRAGRTKKKREGPRRTAASNRRKGERRRRAGRRRAEKGGVVVPPAGREKKRERKGCSRVVLSFRRGRGRFPPISRKKRRRSGKPTPPRKEKVRGSDVLTTGTTPEKAARLPLTTNDKRGGERLLNSLDRNRQTSPAATRSKRRGHLFSGEGGKDYAFPIVQS